MDNRTPPKSPQGDFSRPPKIGSRRRLAAGPLPLTLPMDKRFGVESYLQFNALAYRRGING